MEQEKGSERGGGGKLTNYLVHFKNQPPVSCAFFLLRHQRDRMFLLKSGRVQNHPEFLTNKPGCCDGALLAQRIILNVAQHCYESSKVRSSESSEILDHSGLIQIRAKPFCLIDDVGRKKAHESEC